MSDTIQSDFRSPRKVSSYRSSKRGGFKIRYLVLLAALIVIASGTWWVMSGDGGTIETQSPTFTVQRGDLSISVIEGGNLKALKSKEIKCNVEGQSTIIYLVPEGSRITQEDIDNKKRIVELDSSDIRERLNSQEITFQSANADYVQAKEAYEIQKKQNESDITAGRLAVEFALLDLQKYLGEDIAEDLITVNERIRRKTLRYLQLHLAWEIAGDLAKLKKFHEELTRLARDGISMDDVAPSGTSGNVGASGNAGENTTAPPLQPLDEKLVEEKRVAALLTSLNKYSQEVIARDLSKEREAILRDLKLFRNRVSNDLERVTLYLTDAGAVVNHESLEALLSSLQRYPQKNLSDILANLRELLLEPPENVSHEEIAACIADLRDGIDGTFARMNAEAWLGGLLHPDLGLQEGTGSRIIEGASRQAKRDLENDIGLAMEEIKRAENDLEWTAKLYSRGFVSRNDLEADKIALSRNIVTLERAITALDLFLTYEFYKESEKLISDFDEAEQQLERIKARARAQAAQKLSAREASRAKYELQKSRLEDYQEQLENCVIYAEDPGLVVYFNEGDSWRRESRIIEEGGTVRERQSIITIPDISTMAVSVKVHETSVDRVAVGQKAFVSVDALPDLRFEGDVLKIAILPDQQSRWLNPDLKVYSTDVSISGEHDFLKPGMSAQVEIIVKELKDILYVPLQAVVARDRNQFCLRVNGGDKEVVPVETGDYNDTFIEIKSGLEEGDVILVKPSSEEWKTISVNGNGSARSRHGPPGGQPGAYPSQPGARPGGQPGAQPGTAQRSQGPPAGVNPGSADKPGSVGRPGSGDQPKSGAVPKSDEGRRPDGRQRSGKKPGAPQEGSNR